MTSLVSVQREVEKIKQTVNPDKPKDIWITWSRETVKTREQAEHIKKHGIKETPEDTVETFRVTSKHYPTPAKFICKRREVSEKIAEVQSREQHQ